MIGMREHRDNIDMLRHMLSVLMTKQSSPTLTEEQKVDCKNGIRALQAAVDALNYQVLACLV